MGLIKYLGALLLVGLFTFAVISMATNFANDNNANVDISDDSNLTAIKTNIETDIVNFKSDSQSSDESFSNSTVDSTGATFRTGGPFQKNTIRPKQMFKQTTDVVRSKIFQGDENLGVFLTALVSFILLVGTLYIIKAWIGRNPD